MINSSPLHSPPAAPRVSVAMLAAFVFCLSFKPSEPHLSAYLAHVKHFSDTDINDRIYPVWTYAYFPLLLCTVTSMLLPCGKLNPPLRSIIVTGALGRLSTRILLIYCTSLEAMQLMQVTYAMGSVAEIAFFAYVYDVTADPAVYVKVTSVTQNAYLLSHVVSGVVGDLALKFLGASVKTLFYISAVGVALSVVIAIFGFPKPTPLDADSRLSRLHDDLVALRSTLRAPHFVPLASWWIVGNCVYLFVYGYESSLYKELRPGKTSMWNGSLLSSALVAGTLTVALLSLPRISRALSGGVARHLPSAANRVALSGGLLGLVATAGLALSAFTSWQSALAGLVLFFAAWMPCNAMFLAYLARVVDASHAMSKSSSLLPTEVDLTQSLLLCHDAIEGSDPEEGSIDGAPLPTVEMPSCDMAPGRAACTNPLAGQASVVHHTSSVQASPGGSPRLRSLSLPRDRQTETPMPPYGLVFLTCSGISLALQTALQYYIYTYLEIPTQHSFRVFAVGLGLSALLMLLSVLLSVRR